MKEKLTLLPLVGVEWKGQILSFGTSPMEADRFFGTPDQVAGVRRYYFNGELRLDFDGEGRLEFIECTGGIDGTIQADLYGVSAFQTDAEELLERLKEQSGGSILDEEEGYCVTLPAISVGLYRDLTPAAVEEMVRELSKIDLTAMSEFNLAAEIRRAHHWDAVGVGRSDYYA